MKPNFELKYINTDLFIKKYNNSYFLKIRYDIPGKLFRIADAEICYFFDLDKEENTQHILINLKEKLFAEQALLKFSFHSFIEKHYIIIPQSFFLDKEFYEKTYMNLEEN